MSADDAVGNERGDVGVLVATVLDVVQGLGPDGQPLPVAVVPLGHPSVEIPAVVVERGGRGNFANLLQGLLFEHAKADNYIGHLHPGVVDVVLYLDGDASEAQHADQRIAERGIPEMTDVRSLVGIDRRMLDDRLPALGAESRGRGLQPFAEKRRTVEEEVEVSVGRGGYLPDALDSAEGRRDFLRDHARCLPQPAREFEGDRRAEVAQLSIRRVVERQRRRLGLVDGIERDKQAREVRAQAIVNGQDHRESWYGWELFMLHD